jgi:16S rRNA (guanine527-N7)-methyltransferase
MLSKLKQIGLELSEEQRSQFEKYYEILVSWNEFMNLTGITDHDEVMMKHYIDSLWVNLVKEFNEKIEQGGTLIDVGTGAGFPGLPIKIAFPQTEVTLLDSLNKRINFLNEVISQTGLCGASTCHGRAEDFAKNPQYREQFDICVSRAVANLSTLSEYCLPFVKNDGIFIAYKSGNIEEELDKCSNAVKLLGGKIENVYKTVLPDSDIERSFVVIRKIKPTPKKYPRKAGLPSKEPLE